MKNEIKIAETNFRTLVKKDNGQSKQRLQKYIIGILNLKLNPDDLPVFELGIQTVIDVCGAMTLDEIEFMFKQYATNKLNIEPRSNYFDVMLVGKIHTAYKQSQRTTPAKKTPEQKEKEFKENYDFTECVIHFDRVIQGSYLNSNELWLYSYLVDYKKVFQPTAENRKAMFEKHFKQNGGHKNEAIVTSKIEMVMNYFYALHAKNQHIKDLL